MFHRILNPLKSQSFFIFGARGTGKSTYLKNQWAFECHFINFLEDKLERRYSRDPDLLKTDLAALIPPPEWIIIDEVQKVPKILDLVHDLIENKGIKFILTGSNSRKLKRNQANLLAGRAFNYQMYPLTYIELDQQFSLDEVLMWGSLPKIFSLSELEREEYLRSYCQTYLKEEILQEQIVRNGESFRNFLEIAAQENGKSLNFSKLARDIGIDTKTAQSYFQILEDTLVGFHLPAFHQSARKSIKLQPKFYIFDLGIKRALEGSLHNTITPHTISYGNTFEHFIICECLRFNSYFRKDYTLSHYQTSSGGEIDLILHRAKEVLAIEIKSAKQIDPIEVKKLSRIASALKPTHIYFVSQDPVPSIIEDVNCLHWKEFFAKVFDLKGSL